MARKQTRAQGKRSEVWAYQALNAYTGEVVGFGEGDAGQAGTRHAEERHVRLFQHAIGILARDETLRKESWRVLAYLCEVLDWGNWLVISQTEIATTLGIHRVQISRAIRQLLEHGILLRAEAPAPRTAYRLRAEIAYRGSRNGWIKRRKEEEKEQEQQREHTKRERAEDEGIPESGSLGAAV